MRIISLNLFSDTVTNPMISWQMHKKRNDWPSKFTEALFFLLYELNMKAASAEQANKYCTFTSYCTISSEKRLKINAVLTTRSPLSPEIPRLPSMAPWSWGCQPWNTLLFFFPPLSLSQCWKMIRMITFWLTLINGGRRSSLAEP